MECYKVTKRLTFDDVTVYEVGEVIPLDDEQVRLARAVGAIDPVPVPQQPQKKKNAGLAAIIEDTPSGKQQAMQPQTDGHPVNRTEEATPSQEE